MIDPQSLRLIGITDDLRDGPAGLVQRASAAVRGGATLIQLRLKHSTAREIVEVARALVHSLSVPIIVNDRFDVALASGAAGVHLGADDIPVGAVRAVAPISFIIGVSVGNDDEARASNGADYAGIGPVYGSASKIDAGPAIGVDEFRRLAECLRIPAVAVGGITPLNARAIFEAGGCGVAVIRSIFADSDPESAARNLAGASER